MILRTHVALYAMAVIAKGSLNGQLYEARFLNGLPWLLLPDAVELWGCPKQLSHFWETPDGTDGAWMEFPMGEVLAETAQDNLMSSVKYHFERSKYANCVLGGMIDIGKFDEHNYSHSNFSNLRIHLVSDAIQDDILCKEIVNVNGRYDDQYVMMKNQKMVLSGQQMKKELQYFNEHGFLHLVGCAYRKTHILFNQKWLEEYVYHCLDRSYYPSDLVESVCTQLQIPSWLENKINRGDFVPDYNEFYDRGVLGITDLDELMGVYDRIFSLAYVHMMQNM